MIDIAVRVHNHNYKLDPIVRSLLDTDFYKLLMHQFIWRRYRNLPVTFALKNRTLRIRVADEVQIEDLVAQLDHCRTLRFPVNELIWLQGNTFYNTRQIFDPEYIEYLRTFQLPEYQVKMVDGQYALEFPGNWVDTTLWEIYSMTITSELRSRATMSKMSKFELDVMYARAKSKAWEKFQMLKDLDGLNFTDFGTRRRHSFLWQEWMVTAAAEGLGNKFTGTSNAYLAMKYGLEARGTNAHELPMAIATLAETDEELKQSQYRVIKEWAEDYPAALRVMLPDTFGTTQFLEDAPDWLPGLVTGARLDSKDPVVGGNELVDWWQARGQDARQKLTLFSDGLDAKPVVDLYKAFHQITRDAYGCGTMFTNDFINCHPRGVSMEHISLVCKIKTANGRSAVKLSDNYTKATGTPEEIQRYRRVFGSKGMINAPVTV